MPSGQCKQDDDMRIVPEHITEAIRRETPTIVDLIALWTFASGAVMILDRRVLSRQMAWQPAQLSGHHPLLLAAYGLLYLVACPFLLIGVHRPGWWKATEYGAWVAGSVSAFLALTLIVEALQSGVGWLGAISQILIAGILGVVIRVDVHDWPDRGR